MISVCMPTKDRSEYLAEAINSVLRQTYTDWELIVLDDGSTDSTPELMDYFVKKDNRVKYIRFETNHGIAWARNEAITYAKGQYIAVMDSDDVMNPDRLMRQMKLITKYDFVYSSYLVCNKEGHALQGGWVMPPTKLTYERVLDGFTAPHVTILAKRKCFIDHPYDEKYRVNDDLPLVLSWIEAGYTYKRIRHALMLVRYHDQRVTETKQKEIDAITEDMKLKYGGKSE